MLHNLMFKIYILDFLLGDLSAILFVTIFYKQFEMNFVNTLRNINGKHNE